MKICASNDHNYDNFLRTKQYDYAKGNKRISVTVTTAVMCTKCGDILYPEYPKMTDKELERLATMDMKANKASRKKK